MRISQHLRSIGIIFGAMVLALLHLNCGGPKPISTPAPDVTGETTAILTITSTPIGATVYLDGTNIGQTPLQGHRVDLGTQTQKSVTLGIEHEGYKSRVRKLLLTVGKTMPWEVALEKRPEEIETMATLDVTSTPSGATVYVDAESVGTTPLRGYQVDTGARLKKEVMVGVELAGYKSRVARLTLTAGKTTPWAIELEKLPGSINPAPF